MQIEPIVYMWWDGQTFWHRYLCSRSTAAPRLSEDSRPSEITHTLRHQELQGQIHVKVHEIEIKVRVQAAGLRLSARIHLHAAIRSIRTSGIPGPFLQQPI